MSLGQNLWVPQVITVPVNVNILQGATVAATQPGRVEEKLRRKSAQWAGEGFLRKVMGWLEIWSVREAMSDAGLWAAGLTALQRLDKVMDPLGWRM